MNKSCKRKRILILINNEYIFKNWGIDNLNLPKSDYHIEKIEFAKLTRFLPNNLYLEFLIKTIFIPYLAFKKIFNKYDLIIFHNLGTWDEICFAAILNYKKSLVFWPCWVTNYQLDNNQKYLSFPKILRELRIYLLLIITKILELFGKEKHLSVCDGKPFWDKNITLVITGYNSHKIFLEKEGFNCLNIPSYADTNCKDFQKKDSLLILLPLIIKKDYLYKYLKEFMFDLQIFLKKFYFHTNIKAEIKSHPRQDYQTEKYIFENLKNFFPHINFLLLNSKLSINKIGKNYEYVVSNQTAALNDLVKNGLLGKVYCLLESAEFLDTVSKIEIAPEFSKSSLFSEGVTLLSRQDLPRCDLPIQIYNTNQRKIFSVEGIINNLI